MKYAIGIDIGGTKISMILGNSRGKILKRIVIKTRAKRQSKACLEEMISSIKTLIRESKISKKNILGIGVGVPGAVDPIRGVVPVSPHLPGWQGVPLGKMIRTSTRLPVYMANDANAAAIAEKIFGQAKKLKNFLYMTVSTGVGGGIVANGKLLTGASFVAGEIGHMTVEANGDSWELDEIGCLEAYASGTAIARYVDRELRKGKGSAKLRELKKQKKLTAKEIGALAKKGDVLAKKAYRRAAEYLGIGIGNLLNILNPEMIILGGGVWKSAPTFFWKDMMASAKRRSWKQAFAAVKIKRTKLGDHVGNLGALALVYEAHSHSRR